MDGLKLKTPDEFDMHIKLKFPFEVVPRKDQLRNGFVVLCVPSGNNHPAVVRYNSGISYIDRIEMQSWLREAFMNLFRSYSSIRVGNELYKLEYQKCGFGCSHTILATSPSRTISFDFVPVFEYSYADWPLQAPEQVDRNVRENISWFAVPQQKRPSDDRTFMVCAPHWEREMMKDKKNFKNVVRLMKAMRDTHYRDLPHLSSYMLKTVVLLQLKKKPNYYWEQDLGTLFLDMWMKLVEHFNITNLPFYLAPGCNHFDRMNQQDFDKCKTTVLNLYKQIKEARSFQVVRSLFIGKQM